jgi:hypothetical protein
LVLMGGKREIGRGKNGSVRGEKERGRDSGFG